MNDYQERAKKYHSAIQEILLKEWDPIGVKEIPEAQDEYDRYISDIYELLITNKPLHEVKDYLWWLETEHMGLKGDQILAASIAKRLIDLSEKID